MRLPRFKAPESDQSSFYHVVTRVINRALILHDAEKRQFLNYMRMYEQAHGLKILTYCIMGNHVHILVEVPPRPHTLPTDEELVSRIRKSKGDTEADLLESRLSALARKRDKAGVEALRARYFEKMWDISPFMKVLKQRFSQWYNGSRPVRRKGTLWEERYSSLIVEEGEALKTVAAYIDLNPVRARIVSNPKDYKWSGYGEASAGKSLARKGLQRVFRGMRDAVDPKQDVLKWYARELAEKPVKSSGKKSNEKAASLGKGKSPKRGKTRKYNTESIPMDKYLRMRVRFFTDGEALGSRTFVNDLFEAKREWFGDKRRVGAKTLKGLGRGSTLRTMRSFTRDGVTEPKRD